MKDLENKVENAKESLWGESSTVNETAMIEKAKNFDAILDLIKDKIKVSDKRTITQLLTLAPKSMPRSKVMSTFNVTEYQAKKAKRLFQEKGLLAMPPVYSGKTLSKNVIDNVVGFYENDEFSRLMPGKKDYVSIGRNVHKQKRLILSNIKELFCAFRKKYPTHNIGYSKFCSLRPKWCILPGASGTHSVCVCTYHQNTKLLIEALSSDVTHKDLLAKLVCSTESKECMLGRCKDCPEDEQLRNFLYEFFGNYDEDHQIFYTQWITTELIVRKW